MYRSLQLLSITSSALFLLLLPFRLSKLLGETTKGLAGRHGYAKLAVAAALSAVQALILITTAFQSSWLDVGLVSAIASFIACIGLCPLLYLEHVRSIRPADLIVVYLLVSLACDSFELATETHENVTFTSILLFATNIGLKLALLVVESREKEAILRDLRGQWPPEQLAGVLNRTFFWWINSILALGNRNILAEDSLPPMDTKLSSRSLRRRALQAWDQRARPEKSTTLPKVLALSMLPHLIAPIIPRLFLIVFRYAQPILISTAIRSLGDPSGQRSETGREVIAMSVVVFVGLAISKAVYQHRLNRLKVMTRGAVVGLINNKSLSQQSGGYDDGKAVTLMSTDADSIGQAASMFHETWAQIIEVAVGMAMLSHKVGWVFPVPLVIIFFCSRMSRYLAKNLQSRQRDWNVATQNRIAMTTSMLASMKSLKMLGVTPYTESLVSALRLRELNMARKVRWMMVAYNASANALGVFSPIITFVLFVLVASFKGSTLDTETAFTTTALLGLVTHPANMIMSIVPQAVGSLAAFERIQQYLLQPPRRDQRLLVGHSPTDVSPAICMEDVTIQMTPTAPPILERVNISMEKGWIVMCSGSVGSGKTMLVKSLMGELPTVEGTISVSSKRIACCEQSTWLPSGTLKEAVCGYCPEDPDWYDRVIWACCLDEDIAALPNGDHTMIGSRGLNLSGGQRQRVALARAVYARCDIVLLDDSFSALDGKTESRIVENLIGPAGLFGEMGTTVFLTTNSATHFHLADWLVILGDSTVTYQGTWAHLAQDQKRILKIQIDETKNSAVEEQAGADKAAQSQSLKVAEAVSDLRRATGDISLYGYYLQAVGLRNFLLLLACTSSYSFFITFPQYWLQKWTEAPISQTRFYIGGYLISSLLAWVSTNGSMWSAHILIAPQSGAELHRRLLSIIVGAPLSYFSVTDIGVILNRFSQDMQLVDKTLPPAILSMSNQVFKLVVQSVLLFSAQKIMTMTLPLCMVAVYLVQRIYLRTSRQLRLIDLESRSAVFSSFLESVEGIATIRAFGWEKQVERANIRCLDKSQQPDYLLLCLQQWLGIVLDLMVAALATGLITLAILIRGTTTDGQIGMALNIVLVANTTLIGLVTSWTNMEISLGAISRLKSLELNTSKEDKQHESLVPAEAWPSSGAVEFDNVTVAYNAEALALRDISLKISAGQELVLCGRTGSGKSTLLLTLLRLLDIRSGTIKVDGVDLGLIPRSLIRQRCFITIAQDPFILGEASLCFNLTPSGSLPDETIISALQRICLWSYFDPGNSVSSSKRARQILRSSMSSLPQMSTGQVQLFALARALLKLESLKLQCAYIMPILLLDEATSSVDPETEFVMRRIIKEEFTEKGHTVIAITHRLGGMTESMRPGRDTVALLSRGKVETIGGVEDVLSMSSLQR